MSDSQQSRGGADPNTEGPETGSPTSQMGNQPKSHVVAILVAILVAIGLIAIGVAVFGDDLTRSAQPTTGESTVQGNDPSESEAPEVDVTSPLEPSDIDEELQLLENDVEALDSTEFNEEDLSDEALGL